MTSTHNAPLWLVYFKVGEERFLPLGWPEKVLKELGRVLALDHGRERKSGKWNAKTD